MKRMFYTEFHFALLGKYGNISENQENIRFATAMNELGVKAVPNTIRKWRYGNSEPVMSKGLAAANILNKDIKGLFEIRK